MREPYQAIITKTAISETDSAWDCCDQGVMSIDRSFLPGPREPIVLATSLASATVTGLRGIFFRCPARPFLCHTMFFGLVAAE